MSLEEFQTPFRLIYSAQEDISQVSIHPIGIDLNNIVLQGQTLNDNIKQTLETQCEYSNFSGLINNLFDSDFQKILDFSFFNDAISTNNLDSASNEKTFDDFNLFLSECKDIGLNNVIDLDEKSFQSLSFDTQSFLNKTVGEKKDESILLKRKPFDKRESNKAAAIRYRSKKLKEKDELFRECEYYSKKNELTRKKIDDLQSEISFIKSLLVEALLAKKRAKELTFERKNFTILIS